MKKLYSYIVGAMVMALPVSLVAVAALPSVAGVAEEETAAKTDTAIISFADSTYAMSTGSTTDGDITEPRTFQIGEGTVTVSVSTANTANRIWSNKSNPQLRVYGGTMKFEAPEGRAITSITFAGKAGTATFEPATTAEQATEWAGNASAVTMTITKTWQINTITVVYADANSETVTPEVKVITFETVADIAAFDTLAADIAVRLTLTDAHVTKVSNKNVYVQDASAAVIFYNTNLGLEEGQVLNGTIIGKASSYNGIPEFVANDSTNLDNVTVTEGDLEANEVKVADVNAGIMSQLVKVSAVTLVNDTTTGSHYAVQGTDTVQVYDQFKVLDSDYEWPAKAKSITAIVGSYKGNVQLLPVADDAIEEYILEDGTAYYFYNVGTQKWLCAGNSWGTQASLGDHGLDFTATMLADGTYTLDSRVKNNDTQHYLASNAFVDGSAYGWTVTDADPDADTVNVYLTTADGKYLAYSGNGTVVTTTTVADDNAKWIAISKSNFMDLLKEAMEGASEDDPLDVTWLFQGTDFGRNDQRNSAWQGSYGLGGDNANQNAEKWNSSFDVYQTAEVPNGHYKVVYQGYYRDGGYAEAATARQSGTEALTAVAYANDVQKTVPSIFVAADSLEGVGATSALGSIPNSQNDASKYFSAGLYNDTITGVTVTDGTLKIGIKETTGKSNNWACFDNFRVYYTGNQIDLTVYREAYEAALAAAQEALNDSVVTGDEMTTLQSIVEVYGTVYNESQEYYEEAAGALKEATGYVTNAHANYQALADAKAAVKEYPYASAEKVEALQEIVDRMPYDGDAALTQVSSLQQAEREASESNIKAEADTTAIDCTSLIVNANAADAIDADVWKVSGGKVNIKSNEPWTDADGGTSHRYFDSDNWSDNAWTISLSQNVKLSEGKYILSAISRASTALTDFNLYALNADGDTLGITAMQHIGSQNGLFNRGWDRAYVVFDVPAGDSIVTIGAMGATSTVHSWMSFSDFRLVQFTPEAVPSLEGALEAADTLDVEPGTAKTFTLTLANTGSAAVESHNVKVGYVNVADSTLTEVSTQTIDAIAAGDTLQTAVSLTIGETGTYYAYVADELTGDTLRSADFNVVVFDRDTAFTLIPTDSVYYAYVGQEKQLSFITENTGNGGVTEAMFMDVASVYVNEDGSQDYPVEIEPFYTDAVAAGDSTVHILTWKPEKTGTYTFIYMDPEENEHTIDLTIKVFESEEAMNAYITGINGVKQTLGTSADVYTVGGKMVRKNAETLQGLQKGLYIVNGKKVVVK